MDPEFLVSHQSLKWLFGGSLSSSGQLKDAANLSLDLEISQLPTETSTHPPIQRTQPTPIVTKQTVAGNQRVEPSSWKVSLKSRKAPTIQIEDP